MRDGEMKKFRSMRDQACSRIDSFSKRVKGRFKKSIVSSIALVKARENKKVDKNLKRGIVEIRRDLFDAMEVVKTKKATKRI